MGSRRITMGSRRWTARKQHERRPNSAVNRRYSRSTTWCKSRTRNRPECLRPIGHPKTRPFCLKSIRCGTREEVDWHGHSEVIQCQLLVWNRHSQVVTEPWHNESHQTWFVDAVTITSSLHWNRQIAGYNWPCIQLGFCEKSPNQEKYQGCSLIQGWIKQHTVICEQTTMQQTTSSFHRRASCL